MAEKKNTFLSIDAVLAAKNLPEKEVDVPEWGGKVKVKALSKQQQIAIRKESVSKGMRLDETKMEGLLLVEGIVEPKFERHHISTLFEGPSGPVDRVLTEIMKLSGMSDEDVTEAEEDLKS